MVKVKDEGGMMKDELNAYYARLYGHVRDELRYILDPKEVHGEDFPGETFRVLKEKEVRLYGDASQSDVKAGAGGVGWSGERMKAE